jgi:ubiquitin carboxyl-terminal hydrolase 22/27/51
MDAAIAAKATSLASPKVVKNAKGNIVPSSQMAHIAYGCGMFLTRRYRHS